MGKQIKESCKVCIFFSVHGECCKRSPDIKGRWREHQDEERWCGDFEADIARIWYFGWLECKSGDECSAGCRWVD
jgi:hypothetical protein